MGLFLRLFLLAWRYPWSLTGSYLCLVGATLFSLAIPRLLGEAVDQVVGSGSPSRLGALAGAIVIASLLRGGLGYFQSYLAEWTAQKVAYALRQRLFERLLHQGFAYHDRHQTGDLVSTATNDVEAVRWFVALGLLRGGQILLLVTGTLVLLFLLHLPLALLTLALVPLVVWRTTVMGRALRSLWRRVQDLTGQMASALQEGLSASRLVRAFGGQEVETGRFGARAEEVATTTLQATRQQGALSGQMVFLFAVATALLLWVGGREVLAGRLTPGGLAQFLFYLALLTMPLRMSGWVVNTLARGVSSGGRIFRVLDAPSPVRERPGARDIGRARGLVRYERVSFSYDSTGPALQDVSFEARPGQMVLIVGGPGSGKSTLLHLLPRFYDVSAGRITLDGVDIRDLTLTSLRRNIGLVPQDPLLFSAPIRENIAYGRPEASFPEIVEVARRAQLHDFIASLPEGYETPVGERGITLSGGQRQRLAIARALLLDPPVLLFDDATAHLDAETERSLLGALEDLFQGRTVFIVSHRFTWAPRAHLVLVLQGGRLVEQGRHQDLLARGGLYARLYRTALSSTQATGVTL